MNKKDFVQQWIIRTAPELKDADRRINQAEKLWKAMDARGYGNKAEREQKEYVDHYALIKHKDDFDRFWIEFRLKKGKQGAAKEWNKIDPDQELRQKIIRAGRKEAETSPEGTQRKWAQGWLSERRFDDMDISTVQTTKPRDDGGLQHAKFMLNQCKGDEKWEPYWQTQIDKINGKGE